MIVLDSYLRVRAIRTIHFTHKGGICSFSFIFFYLPSQNSGQAITLLIQDTSGLLFDLRS